MHNAAYIATDRWGVEIEFEYRCPRTGDSLFYISEQCHGAGSGAAVRVQQIHGT